MECMCAQTRPQFILSSERVLGMESEPMLTPREKSPHWKNSPQRRIEPSTPHQVGQQAQHTTNKPFQRPCYCSTQYSTMFDCVSTSLPQLVHVNHSTRVDSALRLNRSERLIANNSKNKHDLLLDECWVFLF